MYHFRWPREIRACCHLEASSKCQITASREQLHLIASPAAVIVNTPVDPRTEKSGFQTDWPKQAPTYNKQWILLKEMD